MFSAEFMKYLINYQKPEIEPTKKEIKFKDKKRGKLAEILAIVK